MSDRKHDQTSYAATLKAAHIAQIDALTREGLSESQRVELFAEAAGFCEDELVSAHLHHFDGYTPAAAVWTFGDPALSLFASLPGCSCPVIEQVKHGKMQSKLIPCYIDRDWSPTVAVLEDFARVQQEARLK
jgi:hypothetical protein